MMERKLQQGKKTQNPNSNGRVWSKSEHKTLIKTTVLQVNLIFPDINDTSIVT